MGGQTDRQTNRLTELWEIYIIMDVSAHNMCQTEALLGMSDVYVPSNLHCCRYEDVNDKVPLSNLVCITVS